MEISFHTKMYHLCLYFHHFYPVWWQINRSTSPMGYYFLIYQDELPKTILLFEFQACLLRPQRENIFSSSALVGILNTQDLLQFYPRILWNLFLVQDVSLVSLCCSSFCKSSSLVFCLLSPPDEAFFNHLHLHPKESKLESTMLI